VRGVERAEKDGREEEKGRMRRRRTARRPDEPREWEAMAIFVFS